MNLAFSAGLRPTGNWQVATRSFPFESLFPPEFVQHRRKARREMLLAWRSFIDRAIERIDEKEAGTEV